MPRPVAHPDWSPILRPEMDKPYFKELVARLKAAEATTTVYPPLADRFNALRLRPDDTRVVVLGQDPYHGPGQAHGLSFSVPAGVALPPSLRNIFQEIENEGLGAAAGRSGDLTAWQEQGVLLLNAALTVERGKANAHQDWGWGPFTDHIIHHLGTEGRPRAFLLWGRFARNKAALIERSQGHLVLESAHPSPYSAADGFFGNGHFRKVNQWLAARGEPPVHW
jgi:uracil-DNA glycosylase